MGQRGRESGGGDSEEALEAWLTKDMLVHDEGGAV